MRKIWRDWKRAFWLAWEKLGIFGTIASIVPSTVYYFYTLFTQSGNFKIEDLIVPTVIFIGSYLIMLTIATVSYVIREPIMTVDADIEIVPAGTALSTIPHFQNDLIRYTSPLELIVHNNEDFEVTDCTATLESVKLTYQKDKNVTDNFIISILNQSGKLIWKSGNNNIECKNTIGARSKEEKILVAAGVHTIRGENMLNPAICKVKSRDKKFNFGYCNDNKGGYIVNGVQRAYALDFPDGLYLIKIRLNGKVLGREIKPVYFNGYVYSDITLFDNPPNQPQAAVKLFIGVDPMKNASIPKQKNEYKKRSLRNYIVN